MKKGSLKVRRTALKLTEIKEERVKRVSERREVTELDGGKNPDRGTNGVRPKNPLKSPINHGRSHRPTIHCYRNLIHTPSRPAPP